MEVEVARLMQCMEDAKKSKKASAFELSDETIDFIMLNVKCLPASEDEQRRIFREFANLRMSREEAMLFG